MFRCTLFHCLLDRFDRRRKTIRRMVKVITLGAFVFYMLVAWAGAQDSERRLQALEGIQAEARLRAIESRLDNLEKIGNGLLLLVSGQIILNGLSIRRR